MLKPPTEISVYLSHFSDQYRMTHQKPFAVNEPYVIYFFFFVIEFVVVAHSFAPSIIPVYSYAGLRPCLSFPARLRRCNQL